MTISSVTKGEWYRGDHTGVVVECLETKPSDVLYGWFGRVVEKGRSDSYTVGNESYGWNRSFTHINRVYDYNPTQEGDRDDDI